MSAGEQSEFDEEREVLEIDDIDPNLERTYPGSEDFDDEEEDAPSDGRQSRAARLRAADRAASEFSNTAVDAPVQPCPEKRFAIEALVVGADGLPVADIDVELLQGPDAVLTSRTALDGRVRFEGLAPQDYRLCLPTLDAEAWDQGAVTALDRPKSAGDAVFASRSTSPAPELSHTVVQGECTADLAFRFGFAPETIWTAAGNAALRRERKHRNVLYPGDCVVIPERRLKTVSAQTGKRHELRRIGLPEVLRVRFLDGEGQPRAGVPYLVEFDGGDVPVAREGKTTADGFLIQKLPPNALEAVVVLGDGDEQEEYVFKLSFLDPSDTLSGVRARLINLGYDCGEEDLESADLGSETRRAITRFQRDFSLPVTGVPDDATRNKLEELHLS